MIEKTIKYLDQGGEYSALPHDLIIAKLRAYGFNMLSLTPMQKSCL